MPTSNLDSEFVGVNEENMILQDDVIAERMAQVAEDEEADAINVLIEKAAEEQGPGKELPSNLLSQFEVIEDLTLDAWASNTIRIYKG